jgi:phage tail tape-measure protein
MSASKEDLGKMLNLAEQLVNEGKESEALSIVNSVLDGVSNLEAGSSAGGILGGAVTGAIVGSLLFPGLFLVTSALGGYFGKRVADSVSAEDLEGIRTRAYAIKNRIDTWYLNTGKH